METEEIRLGYQSLERHQSNAVSGGKIVVGIGVISQEFHAEGFAAKGDRLANAAEAGDAKGGAAQRQGGLSRPTAALDAEMLRHKIPAQPQK